MVIVENEEFRFDLPIIQKSNSIYPALTVSFEDDI